VGWVIARHAFSLIVLPGTVTVLVPLWLARRYPVHGAVSGAADWIAIAAGAALLAVGLALFVWCVLLFATEGGGTLAPWDPPRRLVVRGPYRHVRNPMISSVIGVLFAEAMLLRSRPHALWAATFLALNLVYIPLVEEPDLRARFGEDYVRYTRHVPRVIPRIRPWQGAEDRGTG
jgi:protein-S-isoprenylcysteine O-methyltransferase Ste14